VINVQSISPEDCRPWLLYKHYAKRVPSIAHSFGLFKGQMLIGVVTYGIPANNNLNIIAGVSGLELNRLCVEEGAPANSASFLVGRSLQMLPAPCAVVSYADCGQGHIGYVYQATNWLYTGMGSGDTEYKKDGRIYHRKALFNIFGTGSRKVLESHGYEPIDVEAKHRYVFFVGNRREKKAMAKALEWPELGYPKGETRRYDSSSEIKTQMLLL
jgi:hypothetical protein